MKKSPTSSRPWHKAITGALRGLLARLFEPKWVREYKKFHSRHK